MPHTSESIHADHDSQTNLDQAINDALIEARSTCEVKGKYSPECAVVWDIVEELQAERSHRQQESRIPTSLDYYCYFHPEADECRIYDV